MRRRLDAELVRRGLARSREHAQTLIDQGRVTVGGTTAHKPATQVLDSAALVVTPNAGGEPEYVSRGAHKLVGALEAFEPSGLSVDGKVCLDAGASTGGFTEVLLRRGAARVLAVDVGYGQLAWSLQSDPRVTVMDRTNIRELTPEKLGVRPQLVVADLSFISLRLVLPALSSVADPDGDFALMVKPQFEVGREHVGENGVVRDPELRAKAVLDVCASTDLGVRGVVASPLPGPSGNVEYFVWLRRGAPAVVEADVRRAIEEGPQ